MDYPPRNIKGGPELTKKWLKKANNGTRKTGEQRVGEKWQGNSGFSVALPKIVPWLFIPKQGGADTYEKEGRPTVE